MKVRSLLPLFTLVIAFLIGCKKDAENPMATTCQPPATLTAKAPCESGYSTTLLVASDYTTMGSSGQLIYYVYAQKDTLSNDVSANATRWANASNDQIAVPENVLLNAPKFLVQVTINCAGKLRYSDFFAFVKRPVANSPCYVWALQKQ